jgi:hypothetical protein
VRCSRVFAAIGLVLCAESCGGSGATIVELRVENGADVTSPQFLFLDWLDGERFLFRDRRVPEQGTLGDATPVATIRIELTGKRDGVRRAIVRGVRDGDIVSEGTTTMELGGSGPLSYSVVLSMGRRPDHDQDGVPDEIDGCPNDATASGPCPAPDGGAPDDGGVDAVGEDGGADAVGEDHPLDGGLDRPGDGGVDRPEDRPPDAPPDVGRDMGNPDVNLNVPVSDPVPFNCGTALLVSSSVNSPIDKPLRDRLLGLGCALVQTSDGTLDMGDASGKSVVVVSDNTDGSLVKANLKTVTAGVMFMRVDVLDDNALTGPTDGTDWARTSNETLLEIADPAHPLAAGLSGVVSFSMGAQQVGWGKPLPTAARVGSIVGNPNRWILFGYDTGAAMVGGFVAPGRRVGYPIHADGNAKLNGNGWALFDAAIRWLAGQ